MALRACGRFSVIVAAAPSRAIARSPQGFVVDTDVMCPSIWIAWEICPQAGPADVSPSAMDLCTAGGSAKLDACAARVNAETRVMSRERGQGWA